MDFKIINTQLQANIITGKTENALLISRPFLQYGNTVIVIVKGEEEPVEVKTRFISSEWIQVTLGINKNTAILT